MLLATPRVKTRGSEKGKVNKEIKGVLKFRRHPVR